MSAQFPRIDANELLLRRVVLADLPVLYDLQCDPVSNAMAGTKPRTREVFISTWDQHFKNPNINGHVIVLQGGIVGSIACFQAEGCDCVGYWIARAWWGRGIASHALVKFLQDEPRRPLHATAARTNAASLRILENCGFRCTGYRMGEATDRFEQREIAEFLLE